MNSIFHYCQGESHKATDKPCQDCAYAEHSDSLSMAIVSDGHGGERYFRSQYGSEYAVNITRKAIQSFVEHLHDSTLNGSEQGSLLLGAPFTSYSKALDDGRFDKSKAHKTLQWLFSSIISQWNDAIAQDAIDREVSEWEEAHVKPEYLEEFKAKLSDPAATYEKTYGCTLMAYFQTPEFWVAFHIGDGKFLRMAESEGSLVCDQPIPWDERCFLNKTTSMCDSQALEEFRYCYQGDGTFPTAVFLGSDGLDDSYGDGEALTNFYLELYKILVLNGNKRALKELERDLPIISAKASKDDMSVASVYIDDDQSKIYHLITDYKQKCLAEKRAALVTKQAELAAKVAGFGDRDSLEKSALINLHYAEKDLEKVKEQLLRVDRKILSLKGVIKKFENKHK